MALSHARGAPQVGARGRHSRLRAPERHLPLSARRARGLARRSRDGMHVSLPDRGTLRRSSAGRRRAGAAGSRVSAFDDFVESSLDELEAAALKLRESAEPGSPGLELATTVLDAIGEY